MNYLFGCNPVNKCYISGFGKNTVSKPHHRPSAALKKTMPGMLAGGPCEGLVDAVSLFLATREPARFPVLAEGQAEANRINFLTHSDSS